MKSPVARFARLLMLASCSPYATAQPAAAQQDSAATALGAPRHRDRAVVQGHVPAADQGGRARSRTASTSSCSTIPRSTPSSRPGQTVYVQSGLLVAADNVNQLQGVIAHELGHVAGGHSIRIAARASEQATGITHRDPGPRRAGDRRRRRRCRHGHHGGRPAGRAGQVPRLHPDAGSLGRPGRRVNYSPRRRHQRQGHARLLRQAAEPGIPARDLCQGQLRPHPPAIVGAHPGARADAQGRSRLGQADRPGTRGAVPAGQGQAHRLRRSQAGGDQISRERPERPGPLCAGLCLSPRRLPRQSAWPKPTLCSRPIPTIPSSSSSRARSCSKAASRRRRSPPLREAAAAVERRAADRRHARPRAGRDRGSRRISPRPSRS